MKNLSKLSLLVVFLSIFISTPVFATTPTNTTVSTKAVLLASVDIKDAKIVSQKGNIFNISFSFSNRGGLQTGVKYGVKLVSESQTGQTIIDERVYDESLTLNSNMTTKKDIIYTAPASLSGSYTLMLTSNNSSGFPFDLINLGKVNLTATAKGIEILTETCKLQIGNKTGQTHSLTQRVNVNLGESIGLTCEAMNSSKTDVTATPSYEVHLGTSFGDIITQSGGSVEPVTFKSGEKKSFSVSLPKATIPQIYNVNFTLNDKNNKSNSINVDYMVLGTSAVISNVSIDKDYYNKGDKALVSLVAISNSSSALTSSIQISDDKGKSCAEPQTGTLANPIPPKVDTSMAITSSCINPKISVTLSDDKGAVLAQKEFNVKTTSVPARTSSSMAIYIILILLIIIALYVYFKKKKNTPPANSDIAPTQSTSVPVGVLFFFLLIASFGMIPTHTVKAADTVPYYGGFLMMSIGPHNGTAGDPYTVGQGAISASVSASCGYFCPFLQNITFGASNSVGMTAIKAKPNILGSLFASIAEAVVQAPVLSGYTTLFSVNSQGTYIASGGAGFNLQSTAGTYSMNFADSNGFRYSMPYILANPPVYVPPPAVTVTVWKSSSGNIPYNTADTINWSASSNATNCTSCSYTSRTLSGDCTSLVGGKTGGSFQTPNLTADTVFNISCNDIPLSLPSTPGTQYWFKLHSCQDASNYETGPYSTYLYSTGDLLAGALDNGTYNYRVVGSANSSYGFRNIGVSKASVMICPN